MTPPEEHHRSSPSRSASTAHFLPVHAESRSADDVAVAWRFGYASDRARVGAREDEGGRASSAASAHPAQRRCHGTSPLRSDLRSPPTNTNANGRTRYHTGSARAVQLRGGV